MRLRRTAIGRSLCDEVSLSNQLTPFDAGNPAPTPDRPANERSAWRLDVPPLSHVKCKSPAPCRGRPIVPPHLSISQMVLHPPSALRSCGLHRSRYGFASLRSWQCDAPRNNGPLIFSCYCGLFVKSPIRPVLSDQPS
ncbi:hypothetical protein F4782DRAFT_545255 [Xylaria castorea]|nr:hypothetical protein F4782DRAFT_545255 [Xylaria castorea]